MSPFIVFVFVLALVLVGHAAMANARTQKLNEQAIKNAQEFHNKSISLLEQILETEKQVLEELRNKQNN
ncbi:Uncharacterised protein [Niallia circulans]|uniref:hypothetical protein n=1 Tax=Shouchella clausii TaxID=79880 RepID=UPI000BA50A33|nr:hypothetical protein [Shouchella clausii]MCM3548510.1 hypothetical protein [Shouchella clausii]PAF13806.1 hypothetical protein CHH59_12250 [Shouchella clausii]SPT78376.1 Uncharacterised protein [Niallia circulans]